MVSISQGSSNGSSISVSNGQQNTPSGSTQAANSASFSATPLAGNMDSLLAIIAQLLKLLNKRSQLPPSVGKTLRGTQGSDTLKGVAPDAEHEVTDPARQSYASNLQKWQDSDISNYSFTLQRSCFCIGDVIRPVNIDVENGKVKSATFADTGESLPDSVDYNSLSVDDLFKQIADALDSGAEQVDVKYDPAYGYPASIFINQSNLIADEEVSFSISNFVFQS